MFQQKPLLENSIGAALLHAGLIFTALLTINFLCCRTLRKVAGSDFDGPLLLVIPLIVHVTLGVIVWRILLKRRENRSAVFKASSLAWFLSLLLVCLFNIVLNFTLVF